MKISIITVSYNSASTIRDTFDSVLKQTYPDIEYIIVDGASKDDTVKVIEEYEPRFQGRMRWISEPDEGLYDAMNKGIQMTTGDVVGILNSDDFLTGNTVIEKIAGFFNNQVDCVYGDIHFVRNENLYKSVRYYSSKSFSRWKMIFGFIPAHPSCYIRRYLFEQYGSYDTRYKIASDFDFLLRYIYIHKIRIRYIPLDMVAMRMGGVSTRSLQARRLIMNEHLQIFKSHHRYNNRIILSLRYPFKILELLNRKKKNNICKK